MTNYDLLDALRVQVWTAKPDGLLDFVNQHGCDYFGKSRSELIDEGWQFVLHPADVPTTIARWTESLTTGASYENDFRLLRASDRVYRWHRATAVRLEMPDGPRWLGTNVDIDAERRAEEVHEALRQQVLIEREFEA